ncbi:hypothetical protein GCM10007874_59680 [Labrys miyagiensis]|uniref:Uncharacterized protein n=1 Tax=Labrys miyagiensis TaxID=346912 RepID=A0ABQ6CRJ3_9HYPH|nr:hypothetical protein GCM10007874_59680 [Labrys miyagiensis]
MLGSGQSKGAYVALPPHRAFIAGEIKLDTYLDGYDKSACKGLATPDVYGWSRTPSHVPQ